MKRINFSQAADIFDSALRLGQPMVSPRFAITTGIDQDGREFVLISDANEVQGDHFVAHMPA